MKRLKHIEYDDTSLFDMILIDTPLEETILQQMSLRTANQISNILERKGMLQKDLAELLGKKEAEVSKWLGGLHNFTYKTIAKIQAVLNEPVVIIPLQANQVSEERKPGLLPRVNGTFYSDVTIRTQRILSERHQSYTHENFKTIIAGKVKTVPQGKIVALRALIPALVVNPKHELQPTGT